MQIISISAKISLVEESNSRKFKKYLHAQWEEKGWKSIQGNFRKEAQSSELIYQYAMAR